MPALPVLPLQVYVGQFRYQDFPTNIKSIFWNTCFRLLRSSFKVVSGKTTIGTLYKIIFPSELCDHSCFNSIGFHWMYIIVKAQYNKFVISNKRCFSRHTWSFWSAFGIIQVIIVQRFMHNYQFAVFSDSLFPGIIVANMHVIIPFDRWFLGFTLLNYIHVLESWNFRCFNNCCESPVLLLILFILSGRTTDQ